MGAAATDAAEQLVPLIERALQRAGWAYSDLGALSTVIGPGSFTGCRSGVATLRALALATALPVYPLTRLELLSAAVRAEGMDVAHRVALDARRGAAFTQGFAADGTAIDAARLCALDALPADLPLVTLDDFAPQPVARHVAATALDAGQLARAARVAIDAGQPGRRGVEVTPLYLRAADAKPAVPLVAQGAG